MNKDIIDDIKTASLYQQLLEDLEGELSISKRLRNYIESESSFGRYASIENIKFYKGFIEIKVYDSGYDLYESEIINISIDKLQEILIE
jgi:hypothetical protein